jgi:hypothetical protein
MIMPCGAVMASLAHDENGILSLPLSFQIRMILLYQMMGYLLLAVHTLRRLAW